MERGYDDVGELAISAVGLALKLTPSQRYVMTVATFRRQPWQLRPPYKQTVASLRGLGLLERDVSAEPQPNANELRPTALGRIVATLYSRSE
jgi:hypothetical protein